MTLQQYKSESFDELALRLLDAAALMRELAHQQRESGVKAVGLNDRKLLEWLGNIEVWAQDARGRQQTEFVRKRGAERAQSAGRRK